MTLKLMRTQKIAVTSLFTALALATDYAMIPLVNIKLMDSIVFVSALAFGLTVGVSVASLTWLVYGTVNPWGAATGFWLPFLMVSEMIYALFGSLVARKVEIGSYKLPEKSLLFGFLGFIGAFLYDMNTIVTPELFAGMSPLAVLASLPLATLFLVNHEVSDFIFFATAAPALYKIVTKVVKSNAVETSRQQQQQQQGQEQLLVVKEK
jgi:uncharacterized membrane protein